MVSALSASWGSLGNFLAHLVGLLVALGASLGASWDFLGLLGRRLVPLGASLGPCWDRLGGCWVPLGGCWRLLGSLLARAVSFWVLRGASWAPLGDHLGRLGWVISLRVRISLLEMKFSCYLKMVAVLWGVMQLNLCACSVRSPENFIFRNEISFVIRGYLVGLLPLW